MKLETDKFLIYYNECDNKYLEKMINVLEERIPKILSFFKLTYNGKITIRLYNNLDEYKDNIELSFKKEAELESKKQGITIEPRQYQNWMIANTEDGNINMQSLELVHTQPDYKNYTEEEFCLNACHEITHLCQQQIGSDNPGWFWEVIATTIGNPENQHETTEIISIKDLDENFDNIDGYGVAYTIGKYLFENYNQEFILSLVNDTKKLYDKLPEIIDNINSKLYTEGKKYR